MSDTIRAMRAAKRGPLPSKRQKVLGWVRKAIACGTYRPGERLPDRTWFCRRFRLTPPTVQLAFDELVRDGLVRTVSGHGTRVADELPFARRYLLLLRADPHNVGVRMFGPALCKAVEEVAAQRGVRFEIQAVVDAPENSREYVETLDAVRRQTYAGVLAQGMTEAEHGLNTVTNVDDVPIAFFGWKSVLSQGNCVVPLAIYSKSWIVGIYRKHFEEFRRLGRRKFAVFAPIHPRPCDSIRRELMETVSGEYGLKLVEDGFHTVNTCDWDRDQFVRLVTLFLRSDAGREAEAVVLGDDNMLDPFAACCRKVLGRKGERRYAVSCHCNFPLPPAVDFPAAFHGLDLVATVRSFVDYAEDVHAGVRALRRPSAYIA